MPYTAGRSISPQLLANSAGEATGAVSQNLGNLINQWRQDTNLTHAALGQFAGAMQAHPELKQALDGAVNDPASQSGTALSPTVLKAYVNMTKGKVTLPDAAVLQQFITGYSASKKQMSEEAVNQAQVAEATQKMEMQKAAVARVQQDDQAFQKSIGQFLSKEGSAEEPQFNPTKFMAEYGKAGGSVAGIQRYGPIIDAFVTRKEGKAMDPSSPIPSVDDNGNPIMVTFDKTSGKVITVGKPQRVYESPDEGADKAAKIENAKLGADSARVIIDGVIKDAGQAKAQLQRLDTIEKLYQSGETTGWGQEVLNSITGAAARMGLYPRDKQATKEQLQMALATDALQKAREFYQGQGSVSVYERQYLDAVTTSIGKTPEANLVAVKLAKVLHKRALDTENLRRMMVDADKSPTQIAEAISRFRTDNPLPIFDIPKPEESKAKALGLGDGWTVKPKTKKSP